MKLSKSISLFISIALATCFAAYTHAQANPSLTSAEKSSLATIAAIDKNEILVSVVAENKKVNSNVDDFAEMMIDQHGSNLTEILELANQFNTGSLSDINAEKMTQEGAKDLMKLGALHGNAFAHAYADAMVNGHQAALKLIDDKLMKTARSAEVKAFLSSTRAAVAQHLAHAKKLQAQLAS